MRRQEIEKRLMAQHLVDFDEHDLPANPLDELDVLNHYGFAGRRDMTDRFRILTVNDHSFGNETLLMAVQLLGTDGLVVHYDPFLETLELVRRRAETLQLSERIRFTADLEGLLHSLRETATEAEQAHRFGHFDYVRCCGALDRASNPAALLDLMLAFLKEDGVLGMSCLGYYGRETYRQLQSLARLLDEEKGDWKQEMVLLKELYQFAAPTFWPMMAFENLDPALRAMSDEGFLAEVMREDCFALRVPELYEWLDNRDLHLAQFSRHTRAFYQPWFANRRPELAERFGTLSKRQLQAVSEIAWNNIERHQFWASRLPNTRPDFQDPDNIPFFNYFTNRSHGWRRYLVELPPDAPLDITVQISPRERYTLRAAWNAITRRFVTLVDGYKTFGEIAVVIREESRLGLEEIVDVCAAFLKAVEWEDIILLRGRDTSLLPFTAKQLRLENESFRFAVHQ